MQNKHNVLLINTKDQKVIRVTLKKDRQIIRSLSTKNKYGSQVLLPLIIKLLKLKNCKLKTLQGIEVETGPGSFTGLRVGVSVANALGYSLGIPVNGRKMEMELHY